MTGLSRYMIVCIVKLLHQRYGGNSTLVINFMDESWSFGLGLFLHGWIV